MAGTQEPIYGPSAIKSVAVEALETPYTTITTDDIKWEVQGATNVETQTFYILTGDGTFAILQLIYSSVGWVFWQLRAMCFVRIYQDS